MGYLVLNPVYTYILYDLEADTLYVTLFLNESELIC